MSRLTAKTATLLDAAPRLTALYELWFDYVAQESQGAPPPAGAVGHTLTEIRSTESRLPPADVDRLYHQAVAGYRLDTGRCHRSGCGRVLPCACVEEV
jgi:hypothetical protein